MKGPKNGERKENPIIISWDGQRKPTCFLGESPYNISISSIINSINSISIIHKIHVHLSQTNKNLNEKQVFARKARQIDGTDASAMANKLLK